jgi:hypothetical protein
MPALYRLMEGMEGMVEMGRLVKLQRGLVPPEVVEVVEVGLEVRAELGER